MKTLERIPEGIDNSKYQVFVYGCHAHIPLSLAMHSWFVINKKGSLSRWEVEHHAKNNQTSWGYLHRDALAPFKGISIFSFLKKYSWNGILLGYIEGDEGSDAARVIDFIESTKDTYPYRYSYMVTGPNSNTYVQWVLNHFPMFGVILPMSYIGKKYHSDPTKYA